MTAPAHPLTSLREFIQLTRGWRVDKAMLPQHIMLAQSGIATARAEVVQHLPAWRRPAFELVLRRIQRQVDASKERVVDRLLMRQEGYSRDDIIRSALACQASYSTHAWDACSAWVRAKAGPKKLEAFADHLRLDVLRDTLYKPTHSRALSEIYTCLASGPNGHTINPYLDMFDVIFSDRANLFSDSANLPHQSQVWAQIKDLSETLRGAPNQEREVLRMLCDRLNSDAPSHQRRARSALDILLSQGVDWTQVFDDVAASAQDHIRQHPAYRRAALSSLVEQPCEPSRSVSKPAF